MNIAAKNFESFDADFAVNGRSRPNQAAKSPSGRRNSSARRARKAPQQFNGIHRRRTKKIRW
jgi:hypothetical protein